MEGHISASIRAAVHKDYDFFYTVKCEDSNMFWCGWIQKPDYDKMKTWFENTISTGMAGGCRRRIYIIEVPNANSSSIPAGYMYLDTLIDEDTCEFAVAVSEKFEGQGIATQGINLIKKEAASFGFKKVLYYVREDNLPSQRVCTKNGFINTGNFKEVLIQNTGKSCHMLEFLYFNQ